MDYEALGRYAEAREKFVEMQDCMRMTAERFRQFFFPMAGCSMPAEIHFEILDELVEILKQQHDMAKTWRDRANVEADNVGRPRLEFVKA